VSADRPDLLESLFQRFGWAIGLFGILAWAALLYFMLRP
jgi:hypothetical protein